MRHLWPLPFLPFLLVSCMGTEVGNPMTDVTLDVRVTPPAMRVQALGGSDGLQVTSVELFVARVALRAGDNCSVRGEEVLQEDVTWQLVTDARPSPTRLHLVSDVGSYCQLRVELSRSKRLTYRIRGTLANGTPFLVEEEHPLKFIFSGKNETLALERSREHFALDWDVAQWVREGDFSDDEEDVTPISPSSAGLNAIRQRIRKSVRLARDRNADNDFSAREFEAYEVSSD